MTSVSPTKDDSICRARLAQYVVHNSICRARLAHSTAPSVLVIWSPILVLTGSTYWIYVLWIAYKPYFFFQSKRDPFNPPASQRGRDRQDARDAPQGRDEGQLAREDVRAKVQGEHGTNKDLRRTHRAGRGNLKEGTS
jgi:hypothetical protein